jgi:hypothetical protein
MAYENLAGARADILDGNLRTPETSTQPRIVVLGTATSGLGYELFAVTNLRAMEREFGSESEIARGVHEAIAQGADNIAVMRIGGTVGHLEATSGASVLTIRPLLRDNEVLDRYSFAIIGGRLLVYDTERLQWVFDSDEQLVLNEGSIEVELTGDPLVDLGDTLNALTASGSAVLMNPNTYILLSAAEVASFDTCDEVVLQAGTDGVDPTLPQRYAYLSQAYHLLDWTDGDFVVPMGVYLDDSNLAADFTYASSADLYFNPPVGNDALGYVWEYEYRGQVYTYFLAEKDAGTIDSIKLVANGGDGVKAAGTFQKAAANVIKLTARKQGAAGSQIKFQVAAGGAAGPTVSVSYSAIGVPTILVTDDGTATYTETIAAINLHTEASRWVVASGFVGSSATVATLAATALSAATTAVAGVGVSYLDPLDLVGEAAPAAVTNYFTGVSTTAAQDSQLREVNFAHQLASFCHHASSTWKALMGAISFKGFDGNLTRAGLGTWIGTLPVYTDLGTEIEIASSSDNGTGILGHKLVAGAASYRTNALNNPSSGTSGKAYGGLILTKGQLLPNGSDRPYGILDTDEAVDKNNKPVDLGKYLMGTYDSPIHRNNYNNGVPYRGPIAMLVAAKYATLSEKEEAIGQNGKVGAITAPPKIHATQQNRLALLGLLGIRRETNFGLILTSGRTLANADSDYTDISTMRCLNRELNGIFKIASRFIGKEYSPDRLQSLQQAIDNFLANETKNGFNNGAKATLRYTIANRIVGKLYVDLRMVPPGSIRAIVVEASMAADSTAL